MTAAELERLARELGLDVVGAAPAAAYEETERHIRERRARGLFAGMRFTMAQPEVSCHPETLLPGARTVVSAALCYYAEVDPVQPGEGRLARYTWSDVYADLREELDDGVYGCDVCQEVCPWNRGVERRRSGRRPPPGATPTVSLVEWLEADGHDLVERFDRLYVPRNDARYLRRNALVALGNSGSDEHAELLQRFAGD